MQSTWRDDHADLVIARLYALPCKTSHGRDDLVAWLAFDDVEKNQQSEHFDASMTAVRMFLDLSKDEFTALLRDTLGVGGSGITRLKRDPEVFYAALEQLGLLKCMSTIVNTPMTWQALLTERLKGGRGSAIKGQKRGRSLEDFVEELVSGVFGENHYQARCRFRGARGESTEKADFAIPNKNDPRVLIEVKAYGATGSKQTDVLGDISRIVAEKRADTELILVTDGTTWRDRMNDLRKLTDLQNHGDIARIYTRAMAEQLRADLLQLKNEHGL